VANCFLLSSINIVSISFAFQISGLAKVFLMPAMVFGGDIILDDSRIKGDREFKTRTIILILILVIPYTKAAFPVRKGIHRLKMWHVIDTCHFFILGVAIFVRWLWLLLHGSRTFPCSEDPPSPARAITAHY
jgi:hypothetical protein